MVCGCSPEATRGGKRPHEFQGTHAYNPGREAEAVFIPAEPGDVLVFSSLMLHKTNANTSNDSRLAYVIEYMRMRDFDPFIEPPFLIVARDGEPAQRLVQRRPGSLGVRNQLRYFWPRVQRGAQNVRAGLSRLARGQSQDS
ncbi:MAG: phytanoyl-CoA dioxygenase family protein [Planctomycetota bacterium]